MRGGRDGACGGGAGRAGSQAASGVGMGGCAAGLPCSPAPLRIERTIWSSSAACESGAQPAPGAWAATAQTVGPSAVRLHATASAQPSRPSTSPRLSSSQSNATVCGRKAHKVVGKGPYPLPIVCRLVQGKPRLPMSYAVNKTPHRQPCIHLLCFPGRVARVGPGRAAGAVSGSRVVGQRRERGVVGRAAVRLDGDDVGAEELLPESHPPGLGDGRAGRAERRVELGKHRGRAGALPADGRLAFVADHAVALGAEAAEGAQERGTSRADQLPGAPGAVAALALRPERGGGASADRGDVAGSASRARGRLALCPSRGGLYPACTKMSRRTWLARCACDPAQVGLCFGGQRHRRRARGGATWPGATSALHPGKAAALTSGRGPGAGEGAAESSDS